MTLQEIFAIEDIGLRITELKKRNTPIPDVGKLRAEWDPALHDVMNKSIRKKRKVLVSEATTNDDGKKIPAKYEYEEVNRIAIPFQQDIVNIHTAFTVGREPELDCETNNEDEDIVFMVVRAIEKDNKLKYVNKRAVRAWLAETEVAEYWYASEDIGFWKRIEAKAKKAGKTYKKKGEAKYKLKCKLFSPFLGDTLYPIFDAMDNMIVFSREYKRKENNAEVIYFQTITDQFVHVYKQDGASWVLDTTQSFNHSFGKLPVMYNPRKDGPIYKIVSPIIKRVENMLSDFAECIDHHFFPKTIIKGDIVGIQAAERSQTVKLDGDAEITKLTWQQAPDNIKLELDIDFRQIYSRTQTPDVSFENLKGIGIQSGVAFKYVYMGAHMAVENHAEDVELYLQRRYNFLVHATGKLNTAYEEASETIEITPKIIPYMIDDVEADVSIALKAGGGEAFASRKTIVKLGKLVDDVDSEVAEIESDEKKKADAQAKANEYSNYPIGAGGE